MMVLDILAEKKCCNTFWLTTTVCISIALMIGIEATQVSTFFGSEIFNITYRNPTSLQIGIITSSYPLLSCGTEEKILKNNNKKKIKLLLQRNYYIFLLS